MKQELYIFLTALSYYTRIPIPRRIPYKQSYLNSSTRYFPLIGCVTGCFGFGVYWLASLVFGPVTGILFSIAATVLLTGAFHEDGFADVCDGFGGGWTKERILEIMKDSRLGTYGTTGLMLILAFKFSALLQLSGIIMPDSVTRALMFIVPHTISRFTAVGVLYSYPYARTDDSKSKPIAEELKTSNLLLAALFAFIPLFLLAAITKNPWFLFVIIPLYIVKLSMGRYFYKWIGGYTGDCLGAVQQVAEVICYLFFIIVWKFS